MAELTNFASRQPATFIKGTVFSKTITKSKDMLDEASLSGWNVHLRPLESDARYAKETFEVVRVNPFDGLLDRLGVSGERYHVVQLETIFGLFDQLPDVEWEAAGSFKNGAVVYGQAKAHRDITIDPNGVRDVVKGNIVVSTTFDGSGALNIGRTMMRLDCFNQFHMMFRNLLQSVKIRHTRSADERLKALSLAWKQNNLYFDAVDAEANLLFQKAVTDNQFFEIVEGLMGERPELNTKGAQTKWDNNRELYAQAWNGQPNAAVKGTAWGAFQALVERNQWGRTIQDTDSGLDNFAMAGIGFDTTVQNFRTKALEIVRAL